MRKRVPSPRPLPRSPGSHQAAIPGRDPIASRAFGKWGRRRFRANSRPAKRAEVVHHDNARAVAGYAKGLAQASLRIGNGRNDVRQ